MNSNFKRIFLARIHRVAGIARSTNKRQSKWNPWSSKIECRKCDMRDVCKHIGRLLQDHNNSVDYTLRFRCPVLDKRPDDRAPD